MSPLVAKFEYVGIDGDGVAGNAVAMEEVHVIPSPGINTLGMGKVHTS
jgi:hypothetical protein